MAQAQHNRTLEHVLFWGMVVAMGIFIYLLTLDILLRPWLPEEVAFVLGAGLSYLMANKLFFGYGSLSNYLNKIAKEEVTEEDKVKAAVKSGAHKRALLEELTHFGIASIWLERYEPYRYAYLGLYLLLGGLVISLNLDLVSGLTTGSIVEGFFWGATLISVFVFAADSIVRWQYAQTVVAPIFQKIAPVVAPEQEKSVLDEDTVVCPDADDPDCQAGSNTTTTASEKKDDSAKS